MLSLDVERVMRLAPPESVPPHLASMSALVGRTFAHACQHGGPRRLAELKSAVVTHAAQLRDDGGAPERAVIALKQAIASGDESRTFPSLAGTVENEDDLRRQRVYQLALRWWLEAYYGRSLLAPTS